MAHQSKYHPLFLALLLALFYPGTASAAAQSSATAANASAPPAANIAPLFERHAHHSRGEGAGRMRARPSTAPSPRARPTVRCVSATRAMTASKASGSSSAPAKPAGRIINEARASPPAAAARQRAITAALYLSAMRRALRIATPQYEKSHFIREKSHHPESRTATQFHSPQTIHASAAFDPAPPGTWPSGAHL